ncbi:hypothetical protein [Paenibacillus larvae]|uniref:hypothetical protein n=1 Tax=Paenibacillus larvae TaxID=1464 RepID=UPI0028912772|nr:hypothetical protein [Paenibacillus larvae]MDT2193399.1 hypothetical protein [Paenibacillus larvae]
METSKRGRFNYALWTHEMTYKLGSNRRHFSGVDGYSVGNKYLSRPLYGEQSKYWKWSLRTLFGEDRPVKIQELIMDRAERPAPTFRLCFRLLGLMPVR